MRRESQQAILNAETIESKWLKKEETVVTQQLRCNMVNAFMYYCVKFKLISCSILINTFVYYVIISLLFSSEFRTLLRLKTEDYQKQLKITVTD